MLISVKSFGEFILKLTKTVGFEWGWSKKKARLHLNVFITSSKINIFEKNRIKTNLLISLCIIMVIKLCFSIIIYWRGIDDLCVLCTEIFKILFYLYLYLIDNMLNHSCD